MVTYCSAYGCKNKQKGNESRHFHRFPVNPALQKKWVVSMRRFNWSPGSSAQICSDHFTTDSYDRSKPWLMNKLKPNAIPTIFTFSEHLQPKVISGRKRKMAKEETEVVIADSFENNEDMVGEALDVKDEEIVEDSNSTMNPRTCTGEKPFVCTQCSRQFTQSNYLRRHLRTHTGEKAFACTQCSMAFVCLYPLKRHLRTHTGEKPFACTECSWTFGTLNNLKDHKRTHTGEKPFACTQCNKRFTKSNNLKIHLLSHTGEKSFACTQCSMRFTKLPCLKRHLRTHTGEKPFLCTQCSKRYSDLRTLKKHLLTHTGEKPFPSKQRSNKFGVSGSVPTKLRTHFIEKPFACKQNSKKSGIRKAYVVHIQRNKKAENMQLPGVNCLDLRNQSELQFSEFHAVNTESASVDSEMKIFPVYCKEELNDDTDCKQILLNDENGPICSTTLTDQVDTGISIENIGTIVNNEQLVGSTSSTTLSVKEELPDELMECDLTGVVKQELTETCDEQYEDFKDGEDWKLLVDPFVELFPLQYPMTSSVQLYG